MRGMERAGDRCSLTDNRQAVRGLLLDLIRKIYSFSVFSKDATLRAKLRVGAAARTSHNTFIRSQWFLRGVPAIVGC